MLTVCAKRGLLFVEWKERGWLSIHTCVVSIMRGVLVIGLKNRIGVSLSASGRKYLRGTLNFSLSLSLCNFLYASLASLSPPQQVTSSFGFSGFEVAPDFVVIIYRIEAADKCGLGETEVEGTHSLPYFLS